MSTFDDPTENLIKPIFKGYTIVICKSRFKFKYFKVNTMEEVHKIIHETEDYMYHRQNLSIDPYKYIVVTNRFYRETSADSLFT